MGEKLKREEIRKEREKTKKGRWGLYKYTIIF